MINAPFILFKNDRNIQQLFNAIRKRRTAWRWRAVLQTSPCRKMFPKSNPPMSRA
jgi:hypothetical protein